MNLLQMSLSAGVMIILIIIIRSLLLNELPKITFPILWFVVLVRLAFPFSFETIFSVNDLLLQPFEPSAPVYEMMPSALTTTDVISSQGLSSYQREIFQGKMVVNERPLTEQHVAVEIDWLFVSWVSGLAIFTSFFIFNYWKSHQKIRCAIPVDNEFLTVWKAEQSLKRPLQILVSDQITTPVTTGVLKPKIVLPTEIDMFDELSLQYMLTHELCHIKRWDALWKILTIGVACLHWFNPLVWVMCVLVNRDLEISCDAWVVKKIGKNNKKMYAYTLIEMAEQKSGFLQRHFMPFESGFAKHAAEERIRAIMKIKTTTWISGCVAVLVIGLLTLNAFSVLAEEAVDDGVVDKVIDDFEKDVGVYESEVEIEEGFTDYFDLESIVESFVEVSIEDMMFRVGDISLGERHHFFFDDENFILPDGYISAEEASIIVANAIYEELGINIDGRIFDIFIRPYRISNNDEDTRMIWSGFIVSTEFLTSQENQHVLFYIGVFADTGEINTINHNYDGNQFRG